MAKKRSWARLLFTSLLVGIGVVVARSKRPAGQHSFENRDSAENRVQAAPVPPTQARPREVPSVSPPPPFAPDNPDAPTKPIDLSKPLVGAAEPDPLEARTPQLAFVPETAAPSYPRSAGFSPAEDLVPGFDGGQQAGGEWPSPTSVAAVPGLLLPKPSALGRIGRSFTEWRNATPRREIIYTVVGALCVVAAIVATIVVLTT